MIPPIENIHLKKILKAYWLSWQARQEIFGSGSTERWEHRNPNCPVWCFSLNEYFITPPSLSLICLEDVNIPWTGSSRSAHVNMSRPYGGMIKNKKSEKDKTKTESHSMLGCFCKPTIAYGPNLLAMADYRATFSNQVTRTVYLSDWAMQNTWVCRN